MSVSEEVKHIIDQIATEKVEMLKKELQARLASQVVKKDEERSAIPSKNTSLPIAIAIIIGLVISTAYLVNISSQQQQYLDEQGKTITLLSSKFRAIEDCLSAIEDNSTLCANTISLLKTEISELSKNLKQSKDFEQALNIKMGYINEELSHLRTTTAQFSQASRHPQHQHQPSPPAGKPNRRHY